MPREKCEGGTLEQRIDDLVSLGELTPSGAVILHNLRTLGNQSVYEIKAHDEATLHVAMEIVAGVLSNVYILPQIALNLIQMHENDEV